MRASRRAHVIGGDVNRTAIALAIAVIEARGATPADKAVLDAYRAKQARSVEREVARRQLSYAVARGNVVRSACEYCGDPKVEAHHASYDPPLHVWLCNRCHLAAHAVTREMDRSQEHRRQMTEFERLMALPELFPSAAAMA